MSASFMLAAFVTRSLASPEYALSKLLPQLVSTFVSTQPSLLPLFRVCLGAAGAPGAEGTRPPLLPPAHAVLLKVKVVNVASTNKDERISFQGGASIDRIVRA